ncbi:hypothetical protein CEXT_117651 [Caerostris extrusa]|uniref:Uncharacterized protein n=1 Tax=Caerostris extrusa TaxID=172846 RepID=A0AAV4R0J6_CAEEX|nr:hypothetical protein CEXT_117651 [Caerostris extrusa]
MKPQCHFLPLISAHFSTGAVLWVSQILRDYLIDTRIAPHPTSCSFSLLFFSLATPTQISTIPNLFSFGIIFRTLSCCTFEHAVGCDLFRLLFSGGKKNLQLVSPDLIHGQERESPFLEGLKRKDRWYLGAISQVSRCHGITGPIPSQSQDARTPEKGN